MSRRSSSRRRRPRRDQIAGARPSRARCESSSRTSCDSALSDSVARSRCCALCHSTVDDSFAPGIGKRLDGWPNRDSNVGAIVSLSPDLSPFVKLLDVDEATVRKVLASWGPGKFDAELNIDGKAFRPDGKPAATLLPAAFGLAGVNLHT